MKRVILLLFSTQFIVASSFSQIGSTRPQLEFLYGKPVNFSNDGNLYAHNGFVVKAEFNQNGLCSSLIIQKTQDGTWNSSTVEVTPEQVRSVLIDLSGNSQWSIANKSSGGVAAVLCDQASKSNRIDFVFVSNDYKLCAYMMDKRIITVLPNHESDINTSQTATKVRDPNSMTIADVLSLPYHVTSEELHQKLQNILIPKANMVDVPAVRAFEYLTQVSVKYDNTTSNPNSLGVRFKMQSWQFNGKTVSIDLKDVPLIDAIKYISASVNAYTKIDNDGFISILPVN